MAGTSTPTPLAGRYRVIRRLGRGGMATVFLAEDERLGRRVAVKRLHADSAEDTARRFEREARMGASLNHPNLVSIFDIDCEEDSVLIVMEYVEGPTLGQALREEALERGDALEVVRSVASALDHAHASGIVHRDVKPANVLLRQDGVVKLADLGIATAAEHTQITRTGTVLGTPSYMAPEQLEGGRVEPAVDVYALATVAFEAFTGAKAHSGATPLEIAHRVTSDPPPDVRDRWPDAPDDLAAALARGMARDPAERPASAGALAEEIERALEDDPKVTTRRLTAVAPPAAPEPEPQPEPVAQPRPEPVTRPEWRPVADPMPARRRRSRGPAVLAGVLALAAAALAIVFAADSGDDEPASSSRQPSAERRERSPQSEPRQAPERTERRAQTPKSAAEGKELNDRGYALSQQGNDEAAVPILRRAVEAFPESAKGSDINYAYALFNLGHSLRVTGSADEAIPFLEERLRVSEYKRAEVQRELAAARREAG